MHRFPALFSALVCLLLLAGAGQPAPARKIEFSAEEQAALDRISAYLNAIHTLKSGFIQLGPQGQLDQGEFLLDKPGRLRFAYDPPNPTLIVATGGKIYVKNNRLNTVQNYDVSDVPLDLLLGDNVNLKRNNAITSIDVRSDALVLHARTTSNRQQGNITLVFSNPGIELRQWTVMDNQGATTRVVLHDPVTGVALDDALFEVPVKNPKSPKAP
jgi:outer membrane lipoprotein-sorting protein